MYYEHFGLRGAPFSFTPSKDPLFMSAGHTEGLAMLEWGLRELSGFALLAGDAGIGKTSLIHALMQRQHRGVRMTLILDPRLSFDEMLRSIVKQLGLTVEEPSRLNLMEALNATLTSLG